jgi:hypothetical protein
MTLAVLPLMSYAAAAQAAPRQPGPTVSQAVKFDTSRALRDLPPVAAGRGAVDERGGAPAADTRHTPDGALDSGATTASMPAPVRTFEGASNADNASTFGFMVSPPDSDGDVGMHHYVELINLTFTVFDKSGTRLYGPAGIGTIWQGFLDDCTDASGDPIVLYDKTANRWLLSQFTTRGPEYFNCVAISTSQDPLGSYYRYAFSTGLNFPDYPKYGTWPDAYYITTREFDPSDNESIGVYAVDRRQMLTGNPTPRMVKFNFDSPAYLVGDGILPADLDGTRLPPAGSPEYFVGTMDDEAFDGAPFDGLNVFQMKVNWSKPAQSTFGLSDQVPVAPFDSIFPCSPGSRNCIDQPGTSNKVDILSYRQRPTWRLAYRNFGDHESLVTNQSVEARPGIAGVRWYELRSPADPVLYQQGTYAPGDGVHRWMGSAAMDKYGNLAVGYSVSNATTVYPGIRYAGRLAGDPLGELARGEAVLVNGSGSQLVSARWGDYSSLNVDPADDCTFWYVNEYYQVSSARGWQTRIGAFRFPGC